MSQLANITAYDGAGTPVSHTLVGEQIERLADGTVIARWKESLAGVPDYAQIRVTMAKNIVTGKQLGDDVKSSWPLWVGLHTSYNGRYRGLPTREGEPSPENRS